MISVASMQLTASGAIAVQIVPDDLSNRGRSHPSTFNTYSTLIARDQLWSSACLWQGWRDSNPQPSVLETAVLPIGTTPLKTHNHCRTLKTTTQQRKF
jgi:hypothetical protein